jgi:hypothetical protein
LNSPASVVQQKRGVLFKYQYDGLLPVVMFFAYPQFCSILNGNSARLAGLDGGFSKTPQKNLF